MLDFDNRTKNHKLLDDILSRGADNAPLVADISMTLSVHIDLANGTKRFRRLQKSLAATAQPSCKNKLNDSSKS